MCCWPCFPEFSKLCACVRPFLPLWIDPGRHPGTTSHECCKLGGALANGFPSDPGRTRGSKAMWIAMMRHEKMMDRRSRISQVIMNGMVAHEAAIAGPPGSNIGHRTLGWKVAKAEWACTLWWCAIHKISSVCPTMLSAFQRRLSSPSLTKGGTKAWVGTANTPRWSTEHLEVREKIRILSI